MRSDISFVVTAGVREDSAELPSLWEEDADESELELSFGGREAEEEAPPPQEARETRQSKESVNFLFMPYIFRYPIG